MKGIKGITLITLIITIIILLILAGVTITMVIGENSIIEMAHNAKNQHDQAVKNEQDMLNNIKWESYLSNYVGGEYHSEKGVNAPKLADGMIPITIDSKGNITEVLDLNTNWYSYDGNENHWANAITKDKQGNITAYWVWIPRYAYKISNGYHSATSTGTIEVKFLQGTSNIASDGSTVETVGYVPGKKDTSTNYFLHPVFSGNVDLGGWDSELSGIWVAKFEASAYNSLGAHVETSNIAIGNVTTLIPKVLPNVTSWRNIYTGTCYTNCLEMLPSLNSHMMKNSEWGAVAYLSVSKYGKGTRNEITINNSYLTGGGNYISNVVQSTTGNRYGIYDINGGAWELTANYIANSHTNLSVYGSSFTNLDNPSSNRYVTIYQKGENDTQAQNYSSNANKYGDAIYETSSSYELKSSWYTDSSVYPYTWIPFFVRGGFYGNGVGAGAFCFANTPGEPGAPYTFRPVLSF